MTAVVVVRDLTKRYRSVTALDSVSFTIEENSITGLLGRNGAGKTTVMALLTGQVFRTSGHLAVFGADPVENDAVLSRTCFIKESQRYNEDFKVKHVLAAARIVYSQWDGDFAAQLIEDFSLPLERNIRRLSRGMQSAVGVVVGLASRAPLTFFDEPYLGLDAVARQLFYDRLLADYARESADGHPLDAPGRRGGRPALERAAHRPRPGAARCGGGLSSRPGGDGHRSATGGGARGGRSQAAGVRAAR
jgi:ABC-2 type transport system ATP-binding protein